MISIIIFIIVAAFLIIAAVEFGLAINSILAYPIQVLTRLKPGITKTSVFPYLACLLILLFINSPTPITSDIQSFFETGQWNFSYESGFGAFIEKYWQPISKGLSIFTVAVAIAGAFRIFAATFGFYDKRLPFYEGQSLVYLIVVKLFKFEDDGGWAFLELVPFIFFAIFHLSFGDGLVGLILLISLSAVGSQHLFEYLDKRQQHQEKSQTVNSPKSIQYELFK